MQFVLEGRLLELEGKRAAASSRSAFFERIVEPQLLVSSGVYAAVDPSLTPTMSSTGMYEYPWLDSAYDGPFQRLLAVSAFGATGDTEDVVARRLFGAQHNVDYDHLAGFSVGSFSGWSMDNEIRENSSSGGLTTWLLLTLLEKNLVDGVVHMVPASGDRLFEYRVSRTAEQIRAGAKSRYYPGELSSSLRELIEVPGRYVVVGIPSFIYELRLLQDIDPLFRDRVRYTVGLICGHQKTANYASALGWQAGFEPGELTSIDFRRKLDGEPANAYSTEVAGSVNGRPVTRVLAQNELWGTDWGWGFFKANFSDFTQDAFNETADVVFGDAWLPQFVGDSRGTNVVLARNAELYELLRAGENAGQIRLDPLPVSEVVRSQASLVRQSILELPYRFAREGRRGRYVPALRRGKGKPLTVSRRSLQQVRLEMSRSSHQAYADASSAGDWEAFVSVMSPLVERYRHVQGRARIEAKFAEGPASIARSILRRIR